MLTSILALFFFLLPRFVSGSSATIPPPPATAHSYVSPSPFPTPSTLHPTSSPMLITIPAISLTAQIDPVGLGPDQLQIVPTEPGWVSWYKHGPIPGENGSAVLAGHYKWTNGPAVFYHLDRLRIGDAIFINQSGQILKFRITDIKIYRRDQFPTRQIYTANDSFRLNLVTCHGVFDTQTQDYFERLVIFSELVST